MTVRGNLTAEPRSVDWKPTLHSATKQAKMRARRARIFSKKGTSDGGLCLPN
jgi:hypothetical protein